MIISMLGNISPAGHKSMPSKSAFILLFCHLATIHLGWTLALVSAGQNCNTKLMDLLQTALVSFKSLRVSFQWWFLLSDCLIKPNSSERTKERDWMKSLVKRSRKAFAEGNPEEAKGLWYRAIVSCLKNYEELARWYCSISSMGMSYMAKE